MKNTFLKTTVGKFLALLMLFGCTQVFVSGQESEQGDLQEEQTELSQRNIDGVWQMTVTPRVCATGVPIPTAAFEALLTFHKGGTLSAWFQNSTITITRSPSHGVWEERHGRHHYSFKFVHLRYNLMTGAFIGKQESGGTLVLSESGNEFTTDGFTQLFDVNGNPTGLPGCSNSVGTRFQ